MSTKLKWLDGPPIEIENEQVKDFKENSKAEELVNELKTQPGRWASIPLSGLSECLDLSSRLRQKGVNVVTGRNVKMMYGCWPSEKDQARTLEAKPVPKNRIDPYDVQLFKLQVMAIESRLDALKYKFEKIERDSRGEK